MTDRLIEENQTNPIVDASEHLPENCAWRLASRRIAGHVDYALGFKADSQR